MSDQSDQPASRGFYVKFSPSDPRDVQLSQWIRADTTVRTVNVSAVIKTLLYSWYQLRWRLGRVPAAGIADLEDTTAVLGHNGGAVALPAPAGELGEDPNDSLVQRMVGLTFDEWQ